MLTLTAASAIYIPHATGSSFAPTEVVQGTPLVLQGSGTRYRAIFKVYDMALYLPRKVQTVEEALQLNGPVGIQFLALRDLPGADLGLSFIRGLKNNATPEQMQRYTLTSNRLIEIFFGPQQSGTRRDLCHGVCARPGHDLFHPRRTTG